MKRNRPRASDFNIPGLVRVGPMPPAPQLLSTPTSTLSNVLKTSRRELSVKEVSKRRYPIRNERLRKASSTASSGAVVMRKDTMDAILKLLAPGMRESFPVILEQLLLEARQSLESAFEETREEIESETSSSTSLSNARISEAFLATRVSMERKLHMLHPLLRMALSVCKENLNHITMANFDAFTGQTLDLDTFCGNLINEAEKMEETLMATWFVSLSNVFASNNNDNHDRLRPKDQQEKGLKKGGMRKVSKRVPLIKSTTTLQSVYHCASVLVSIQLRELLMRSVMSFVSLFSDARRLPRIEMALMLDDNQTIAFRPSISELHDTIASVINEMSRLLREVPTVESWVSGTDDTTFVSVSLDESFIASMLDKLSSNLDSLLIEPIAHAKAIAEQFNFLIDGRARRNIENFIETQPRFEAILNELSVYERHAEQTQRIASLEYFAFIRLDCDEVRRGLSAAARSLSSLLLKNIVDTYRKENVRICEQFESIEQAALTPPQSTRQMIALGEFMLEVRNTRMTELERAIEESSEHLLRLIDVHIFCPEDIELNTKTLCWPQRVKPVFEQNTEIVEDCKAAFEDNLQKKSDWILRELEKLTTRIADLEDLGDITKMQAYNHEVRLIQRKLSQIEDAVCWVNAEEFQFKFPQTVFKGLGDANTIKKGDSRLRHDLAPYVRLFDVALRWQKSEKRWMDGAFLELKAHEVDRTSREFFNEVEDLKVLFRSRFKQQALAGNAKFAKANLDDTDPNHLPPPLKICALTAKHILDFRAKGDVIRCLCNPGIRSRHWSSMSSVLGFDMTPNSGSSLRKMLLMNLEEHMKSLEQISMAATREAELETQLQAMREEWKGVVFTFQNQKIPQGGHVSVSLSSVENIQSLAKDHSLQTLRLRGSPFHSVFTDRIDEWTAVMSQVQVFLNDLEYMRLQWPSLEALFNCDIIVTNMKKETNMFKNVIKDWKKLLNVVQQEPHVIHTVMKTEIGKALAIIKDQVLLILNGAEEFVEGRIVLFPRLAFLSSDTLFKLYCDPLGLPASLQPCLRLLFPGGVDHVAVDHLMQDVHAMVAVNGEHLPFLNPVKVAETRGSVDIFLNQMRAATRASVLTNRSSLTKSLPNSWSKLKETSMTLQSSLLFLTSQWSDRCLEAIKGGNKALQLLSEELRNDAVQVCKLVTSTNEMDLENVSVVNKLRTIVGHLIRLSVVTDDLRKQGVDDEKDHSWVAKPKCYMDTEVVLEVGDRRWLYGYEFWSNLTSMAWNSRLEQSFIDLITCSKLAVVQGPRGKTSLVKEAAFFFGQPLFLTALDDCTRLDNLERMLVMSKESGMWLLFRHLDRLPLRLQSGWVPSLRSVLQQDDNLTIVFTSERPTFDAPFNLKKLCRPVSVVTPSTQSLLELNLLALGSSEDSKQIEVLANAIDEVNRSCDQTSVGSRTIIDFRHLSQISSDSALTTCEGGRVCAFKQAIHNLFQLADFDLRSKFENSTCIFADPKLSPSEVEKLDAVLKSKGLLKTEGMEHRLQSLFTMLKRGRAVIVAGSTMTGKSTFLEVASQLSGHEICSFRPLSLDFDELYGHSSHCIDGKVIRHLRAIGSKESAWLVFRGSLRPYWCRILEELIGTSHVKLPCGESVTVPQGVRLILETDDLKDGDPSLLSRCGFIPFGANSLCWRTLIDRWLELIRDEMEAWKREEKEFTRDLLMWIVGAVVDFIFQNNDLQVDNINPSVRHVLDLLSNLMSSAMSGLRERKYLRPWIEAGSLFSVTWGFSIFMASEFAKSSFDAFVRDLTNGRDVEHPLPTILNGKFDALLPPETNLFELFFDFKARGQWKAWTEALPTVDEKSFSIPFNSPTPPLIHTSDTYRCEYLVEMSGRDPVLVMGPRGSGKTVFITSKLASTENGHLFNATETACGKDLSGWLTSRLGVRQWQHDASVPESSGHDHRIFIDDLGSVKCEHFHETLTDFIESTKHSVMATTRSTLTLPSSLVARFNRVCISESESSMTKVLSLLTQIKFRTRSFSPEVTSVVSALVQSTLNLMTKENFDCNKACRTLLSCSNVRKEMAENNKRIFAKLWVYEACRNFLDCLEDDQGRSELIEDIKKCLRNEFRENPESIISDSIGPIFLMDKIDDNQDIMDHVATESVDGVMGVANRLRTLDNNSKEPHSSNSDDSNDDNNNNNNDDDDDDKMKKKKDNKREDRNDKLNDEWKAMAVSNNSFVLEMISHVGHALTHGHVMLVGPSNIYKRLVCLRATALVGHRWFEVDINNPKYDFEHWRDELKLLLKELGTTDQNISIFINVEDDNRLEVVEKDLHSILAQGEVSQLFSDEDQLQIAHVIKTLLQAMMTRNPQVAFERWSHSSLMRRFRANCRRRLRLILSLDKVQHEQMIKLNVFEHNTFTIFMKEWPQSALSELVSLKLTALNDVSKQIMESMENHLVQLYLETREMLRGDERKDLYLSVATLERVIELARQLFEVGSQRLQTRRLLLEAAIDAFAQLEAQVVELESRVSSLRPTLASLSEEQKTNASRLQALKEDLRAALKTENDQTLIVNRLRSREKELRSQYDQRIQPLQLSVNESRERLLGLRSSDFAAAKSLKGGVPSVRSSVGAMAVLMAMDNNNTLGKKSGSMGPKNSEVIDLWTIGKRALMESGFVDRLNNFDVDKIPSDRVGKVMENFVNKNDWNPIQAGKSFAPALAIAQWVEAVGNWAIKKKDLESDMERMRELESEMSVEQHELESLMEMRMAKERLLEKANKREEELRDKKMKTTWTIDMLTVKHERGLKLIDVLRSELEGVRAANLTTQQMIDDLPTKAVDAAFLLGALMAFNFDHRHTMSENLGLDLKDLSPSEMENDDFVLSWSKVFNLNNENLMDALTLLPHNLGCPLLLDPDGLGLQRLHDVHVDRLRLLHVPHVGGLDTEGLDVVSNALDEGSILILQNLTHLDGRLEDLLSNCSRSEVLIGPHRHMRHPDFKVIILITGKLTKASNSLLTKCAVMDCSAHKSILNEIFLDTIFELEQPEMRERLNISKSNLETQHSVMHGNRSRLLTLLSGSSRSNELIHDDETAAMDVFENEEKKLSLKQSISSLKEDIGTFRDGRAKYTDLATHALTLYTIVQQVKPSSEFYAVSLHWYLNDVLKDSLMRSHRSKRAQRRVHLVRDHLTLNVLAQVAPRLPNSEVNKLAVHIAIAILQVQPNLVQIFQHILDDHYHHNNDEDEKDESSNTNERSIDSNDAPSWLSTAAVGRLTHIVRHVDILQELWRDVSLSSSQWTLLYTSKEPESMPLPSSLSSLTSPFLRLLILAALRPDRATELQTAFVRSVLGDNFVELWHRVSNNKLGQMLKGKLANVVVVDSDNVEQDVDLVIDNTAIEMAVTPVNRSSIGRAPLQLCNESKEWLVVENLSLASEEEMASVLDAIVAWYERTSTTSRSERQLILIVK